jgi:hypothetical protein
MFTDEQVFEILRVSFPSLDEGHFRLMKQTRHSVWVEVVYDVLLRTQKENAD